MIRLPCRKLPANAITPRAPGTPLGFALGQQPERAAPPVTACSGKKRTWHLNSQGAAAFPSLCGHVPPEPPLWFRASASSLHPSSSYQMPDTCTLGERVLVWGVFTSCWLWLRAVF